MALSGLVGAVMLLEIYSLTHLGFCRLPHTVVDSWLSFSYLT